MPLNQSFYLSKFTSNQNKTSLTTPASTKTLPSYKWLKSLKQIFLTLKSKTLITKFYGNNSSKTLCALTSFLPLLLFLPFHTFWIKKNNFFFTIFTLLLFNGKYIQALMSEEDFYEILNIPPVYLFSFRFTFCENRY